MEDRVTDIIGSMTLGEKIGSLRLPEAGGSHGLIQPSRFFGLAGFASKRQLRACEFWPAAIQICLTYNDRTVFSFVSILRRFLCNVCFGLGCPAFFH
jgi:hypothetical protein